VRHVLKASCLRQDGAAQLFARAASGHVMSFVTCQNWLCLNCALVTLVSKSASVASTRSTNYEHRPKVTGSNPVPRNQ
jgi:hypothetical protein